MNSPSPDAGFAWASVPGAFARPSSKPVAMTVTRISSSRLLSKVAPKMMFASGCAASCTRFAAASTSSRPMSSEPVTFISTPCAPFIEVSIKGLATAIFAASSALPLPTAWPTPMCAKPASFMIVVTSAKSRLIKPVFFMRSEMLVTAWRSTSSAISKAFASVTFWSVAYFRRSFGMMSRESTLPSREFMPVSAWSMRRLPSNLKGLVTTPTVSAPASLAISATVGAAPVPVPPPMPAVMNTMSASSRDFAMSFRLSSALRLPTSGSEPAPWPWVSFSPIWIFWSALETARACLSVLTEMNSTPCVPDFTMRFTTLLPAPPTPTTFSVTTFSGPVSVL